MASVDGSRSAMDSETTQKELASSPATASNATSAKSTTTASASSSSPNSTSQPTSDPSSAPSGAASGVNSNTSANPSVTEAIAPAGTKPQGPKAASKPPASFPAARLEPAPVPSQNPWGAQSGPTSRTEPIKPIVSPVVDATTQLARSQDSSRRSDDRKDDKKDTFKQRTTGKEKWVPYTPVVTTTPPPGPSSSHAAGTTSGARPKQKQRNKRRHQGGTAGNANGASSNGTVNSQSASPVASSGSFKNSEGKSETSGPNHSGRANGHAKSGAPREHSGTSGPGQSQINHSGNQQQSQKKKKDHERSNNFYPVPANGAQAAAMPQYDMRLPMLIHQMEYYFSIENLCKDTFMRSQMNSKGLVPMSLIGDFNRVKTLSGGQQTLVVEACKWAPSAEIVGEKVRLREGWENWVLPEDRRQGAGLDENDDETPKFQIESAVPFVPKTKAS